jgi:hypothetical protein
MARLYDEVRGVLEQRSKPETQFEIYKNTKQDKINAFMNHFTCSEEEVLMSYYLANFIITGDITSHVGPVQRISDDERIEKIVENVVEGKNWGMNLIPTKTRIFLLQLTWTIGWELDKAFQRNSQRNTYPIDVIFTQIIDHLIIPLLVEWLNIFEKLKIDTEKNFIWILAEASGAFQNDFPKVVMNQLKDEITTRKFSTDNLFVIGWILCQEYLKYLQNNDYIGKELPRPTSPHLNDDFTIGGLIIYKVKEKEIYPLDRPSIYTSRMAYGNEDNKSVLALEKDNLKMIKNFLSLDHPAITTGDFLFSNSRCNVIIEDNEGKKSNRFIFSFNKKDESKNVGMWVYFMIQAEDVNFKQLDEFLDSRLVNILPILRLQDKNPEFKASALDILNAWVKTLVVELQDEFNYVGHIEDLQKSQRYTLMAISEATSRQKNSSLVYESPGDDNRLFQSSGSTEFVKRLTNLFTICDYIFSMNGYFMQLILTLSEVSFKGIRIIPSEMFYTERTDPSNHVFVVPFYYGGDDPEEGKLVTGIAYNKPPGDVAYKNKPMESRRNIQRSIRLIGESKLVTKDLAKLVKERISNNFPLPLKEEKFNEMWPRFFDTLKSSDKSKLADLDFSEKIQALEAEQMSQYQKTMNNVVYYVIKEVFIPIRLSNLEMEVFRSIAPLGNEQDVQNTRNALRRRIESADKKLDKLKEEDMKLIIDTFDKNKQKSLKEIIDILKGKLLEKFKSYSEKELNDILISI